MATQPQFIGTPVIGQATVSTANTSIAVSTGLPTSGALLITGATNGTRVLEIVTSGLATVSQGIINVWLSIDSGTTYILFDQIAITAATSSATSRTNRVSTTYSNLVLRSTHRLAVTTTITQNMVVTALGGDL